MFIEKFATSDVQPFIFVIHKHIASLRQKIRSLMRDTVDWAKRLTVCNLTHYDIQQG